MAKLMWTFMETSVLIVLSNRGEMICGKCLIICRFHCHTMVLIQLGHIKWRKKGRLEERKNKEGRVDKM